jgi:hypothetical protein
MSIPIIKPSRLFERRLGWGQLGCEGNGSSPTRNCGEKVAEDEIVVCEIRERGHPFEKTG